MRLKQGTLLQGGKYSIERVLGQGGFGITYLAEQANLGRKVAIKEFFLKGHCNRESQTMHITIPSEGSREMVKRFKEKFIKEAKTIATLNHPNIVKIFDVFEENSTAYFVMDYIDNGNLNVMTNKGPLKEIVALIYIRQIANALEYLHNRNILHLDIKPSNVLVNKKGEAVLIDFGISKKYDEIGDETSSTPVGISRGYAPLEQYNNGLKKFSPSTDIYSLGATLYRLLTGTTPPEASNINEEGLPSSKENVSKEAWRCIIKCMQPKRRSRPQNIQETLLLINRWEESLDGNAISKIIKHYTGEITKLIKDKVITRNFKKVKHGFFLYPKTFNNKCKEYLIIRYYLGILFNLFVAVYVFIILMKGGMYDYDWDYYYNKSAQWMLVYTCLASALIEFIILNGKSKAIYFLIVSNLLYWFFCMFLLSMDPKTGISYMELGLIPMIMAWATCSIISYILNRKGTLTTSGNSENS